MDLVKRFMQILTIFSENCAFWVQLEKAEMFRTQTMIILQIRNGLRKRSSHHDEKRGFGHAKGYFVGEGELFSDEFLGFFLAKIKAKNANLTVVFENNFKLWLPNLFFPPSSSYFPDRADRERGHRANVRPDRDVLVPPATGLVRPSARPVRVGVLRLRPLLHLYRLRHAGTRRPHRSDLTAPQSSLHILHVSAQHWW